LTLIFSNTAKIGQDPCAEVGVRVGTGIANPVHTVLLVDEFGMTDYCNSLLVIG